MGIPADAQNQRLTFRAVLRFIFDLADQPSNNRSKDGLSFASPFVTPHHLPLTYTLSIGLFYPLTLPLEPD
jgi:hypothetical protein